MEKRFVGRSHQKRTIESRCTAAVWLLYDVPVDTVHETSSLVSDENVLSFRPSFDGHHLVKVPMGALNVDGTDGGSETTFVTLPRDSHLIELASSSRLPENWVVMGRGFQFNPEALPGVTSPSNTVHRALMPLPTGAAFSDCSLLATACHLGAALLHSLTPRAESQRSMSPDGRT
ncbi:unnamed protein product [Protopolystoma xenopodis]|uniref:Uncharacterized protein n=1 Tax=Protopolystoma xenopodis TaxID=117903 RepID=A0A3S5B5P2_9PLAT|nr:unnamed protein product [Protopolystoma xenopodis]